MRNPFLADLNEVDFKELMPCFWAPLPQTLQYCDYGSVENKSFLSVLRISIRLNFQLGENQIKLSKQKMRDKTFD